MRDRRDFGNGPHCPINAEHGRMYEIGNGLYCPHSDHNDGKTPNRFESDGVTPRKRQVAQRA